MKIKETISLKTLSKRSPGEIELTGDEVIRLVSVGHSVKMIVTQEYLMGLRSIIAGSMGNTQKTKLSAEELINELDRIIQIAKEDSPN